MSLENQVYRADRARELLENEVFKQIFEDYRQEITEAWKKSPANDAEGREKCFIYLSMLNKLEGMIKETIDSGKLATKELEHRRKLMDRVKEWAGSN